MRERTSPLRTTLDSIQAEYIKHIDRGAVEMALTASMTKMYPRVKALQKSLDKKNPPELRKKINEQLSYFIDHYFENGKIKPSVVRSAAETMIQHISVITLNEMIATARNVVENHRGKEIVLFVPRAKINLSASRMNSNVFLAQIVDKFARRAGKKVVLATGELPISKYRHIVIIDDAIYSGEQLGSTLRGRVMLHPVDILRARRKNLATRLNIYCAAASEAGQKNVLRSARMSRLDFQANQMHVARRLPSVKEMFSRQHPEVYSFFFARGLIPASNSSSLHTITRAAHKYVSRATLTVSEIKPPDFLSFPEFLSVGIPQSRDTTEYPSVDSLNL